MTRSPPRRRTLQFDTLSDVLADARDVVHRPHTTVGRWTCAQILEHLAVAMDLSFDGYGFQAPWWIRLLTLPVRNRFLVRPMPAGVRLPRRAAILLPRETVSEEVALQHLERSIARFDAESPGQPHPVFGRLTPDEYRLLHLRHCELHQSFVIPD